MARSDLQPPTDHYTFIPGEPGEEAPMSNTSIMLPSRPPATASWMHRRGFLIGAGAAGMALGAAMGRAYTQITTAPDYSLRIAPLRLELAPGKVIDTFAYNGTVPGPVLRLARRPAGQHRYPQRHRRRRHHSLARALRAFGCRWRDGGRIADGRARRHAALHVRRQADGARAGITAMTWPEQI